MKRKNLILIGMPGCGKSTVGVVLAKTMGYRFLDSDLVIQEQEDRLLCEIIEQDGLEGFLETEDRINASINIKKTVIATGGSVVYGKNAMRHYKETGIVIYIELPYEEIKNRLGDLTRRGVAMRQGETLFELYEERKPLYEQYADITVHVEKMNISETALKIKELVNEYVRTNKRSDRNG